MTNTTADPKAIALLARMADEAGKIVHTYWRAPAGVERKADASPVTLADREIETQLRDMIEKEFPGHGIIGEEHGNVRPEAAWQWVIDPIDGTRSFVAGYPIFATLVALAKDKTPVLGLIEQPITKERWIGISGQRTTCNGKPVSVSKATELKSATVATTSTDYFSALQAQKFATLKKQSGRNVIGGDAYAYAMLASGCVDLVVDGGLKPYDFCALAPVVEGAGGIITDWAGKKLTIESDGAVVAAATKELHAAALVALA